MYVQPSAMGLSGYFPYGMGDAPPPGNLVSTGGSLIGNTINLGVQTGQIAEEGITATIGSVAGPIGQIAGTLISLFMQVFSGCGQTCTLTSKQANQVQSALQQNLAAWNASQKTQTEQAAALANFDYAWSQLQQVCGSPSMGNAGVRCLSERQRGGVSHWCCTAPPCTASSGPYDSCSVPSSQSCNGGPPCCTGCDYFKVYRDPIANDPAVIANESAVLPIGSTVGASSGAVTGLSQISSGTVSIGSVQIPTSLLLLVGAAVLVVVVAS